MQVSAIRDQQTPNSLPIRGPSRPPTVRRKGVRQLQGYARVGEGSSPARAGEGWDRE